ncbi:hypothetical protein [Pseudalkalibacillus sp. NRS-1564]|uniref:hypothetical protein n=1 Tax=Pseudalkalibacillus sp. NRS-1564 TaxID=3233900 RepID=UPI003D2C5D31
MNEYSVEFQFNDGKSLVHVIQAESEEQALSSIPLEGYYEFSLPKGARYRIYLSGVNCINVAKKSKAHVSSRNIW